MAKLKRREVLTSALFFILAGVITFFLSKYGFINFEKIKYAFDKHPWILFTVAAFQFVILVFSSFRFHNILELLSIRIGKKEVFSANILSQGIGQWLPSSIAFIESFRIGILIVGHNKETSQGIWKKIASAAFLDRIIAQIVMQILGALAAIYLLLMGQVDDRLSLAVGVFSWSVVMVPVVVYICIAIVPEKSKMFFSACVDRLPVQLPKSFPSLSGYLGALKGKKNDIWKTVFMAVGWSAAIFLLSCASFYLCGYSMGSEVSFMSLAAVVPLLIIASVLPISFAGIGGQQFVAIGLFSLFSQSSESGSIITFFAASFYLVVYSVYAIIYAILTRFKVAEITN